MVKRRSRCSSPEHSSVLYSDPDCFHWPIFVVFFFLYSDYLLFQISCMFLNTCFWNQPCVSWGYFLSVLKNKWFFTPPLRHLFPSPPSEAFLFPWHNTAPQFPFQLTVNTASFLLPPLLSLKPFPKCLPSLMPAASGHCLQTALWFATPVLLGLSMLEPTDICTPLCWPLWLQEASFECRQPVSQVEIYTRNLLPNF